MAMPALKIEAEVPVEEHIARLGANVENIQVNGQRLEAKVDRLDIKIDEVDKRLSAKIDSVKDSVAALAISTEKSFAAFGEKFSKLTYWIVGLQVTIAIALLGITTGGFLWLANKIQP